MPKTYYTVEIFLIDKQNPNGNWVISSRHKNEENAIINANIISKSRKCESRGIFQGEIIFKINENKP